jgi:hypothetical protein
MDEKNLDVIKCAECGLLISRSGSRCFDGETSTTYYCKDCYKKVNKEINIWVYITAALVILFSIVVFIFLK